MQGSNIGLSGKKNRGQLHQEGNDQGAGGRQLAAPALGSNNGTLK